MRRTFAGVLVVAACALLTSPAWAQEEQKEEKPTVKSGSAELITIHGFISASWWAQDHDFGFGNGQNAEFVTAAPKPTEDPWFADGDVRNTRLTLSMSGLDVGDMVLGGTLEADFFGGFNGNGPFSDEMPIPRLRLAYAQVSWGNFMLRAGQAWSPLFGNVPVSPTHLAFPLGYGSAGMVGWRFPGLYLYYTFPNAGSGVTAKVTLAAMRGSWTAVGDPNDTVSGKSAGNAAIIPQIEARLDVDAGKLFGVYVVGHFDRKDLSGVGATGPEASINGWAAEAGLKVEMAPLHLQGNGYVGRAMGQQFGNLTQFGDIFGWGAWGQIGFDFTPKLSAWGFYGIDNPDDTDVLDSGNNRLQNQDIAASVRYSVGSWSWGVEWLHSILIYGADQATSVGNQWSVSALWKF